jgi:predicted dehydrogenase
VFAPFFSGIAVVKVLSVCSVVINVLSDNLDHIMKKINWGIIGCGDVTEIKSGPAFNKVQNSALVAVMRRDAEKAADYARRHNVPRWYSDAGGLINDPDVNAIYVATPPSSHEAYTLAAIASGKPVYVEKPMSVNATAAGNMAAASREKNIKLCVAHYRRAQPLFRMIKQLLDENVIGEVRFARIDLYKKALTKEELATPLKAWRVNEAVAGGGLFHDLAPHQLDILCYLFGEIEKVSGIAHNQARQYVTDDIVAANLLFRSGVVSTGLWCFNAAASEERDSCEIIGDKGKIEFSFFDHRPINVVTDEGSRSLSFEPLQHVQQPMIEKVVSYFLDEGPNPCSGDEGVTVMNLIDRITAK